MPRTWDDFPYIHYANALARSSKLSGKGQLFGPLTLVHSLRWRLADAGVREEATFRLLGLRFCFY
jgi:hypothetical protein